MSQTQQIKSGGDVPSIANQPTSSGAGVDVDADPEGGGSGSNDGVLEATVAGMLPDLSRWQWAAIAAGVVVALALLYQLRQSDDDGADWSDVSFEADRDEGPDPEFDPDDSGDDSDGIDVSQYEPGDLSAGADPLAGDEKVTELMRERGRISPDDGDGAGENEGGDGDA
jgi:hypothetical protein